MNEFIVYYKTLTSKMVCWKVKLSILGNRLGGWHWHATSWVFTATWTLGNTGTSGYQHGLIKKEQKESNWTPWHYRAEFAQVVDRVNETQPRGFQKTLQRKTSVEREFWNASPQELRRKTLGVSLRLQSHSPITNIQGSFLIKGSLGETQCAG